MELGGFVDKLMFNVRYAVRRLQQSPVFTMVAIVSLALGIGANTAMFSLVNAIVIRDLPFEEPETLVNVYESVSGSYGQLSYPDYEDLAEGSTDVFAEVSGMMPAFFQADVDDGVENLFGEAVTGNYFSLPGIQPALGRLLTAEDHVAPGAHPVVVLGHGYWERRYGKDPAVVGSEIRFAGRQYTIIGVVPEAFTGRIRGFVTDAYVPIMMYEELMFGDNTFEARDNRSVRSTARLLPGVTMAQAEAVAAGLATDLREEYPSAWLPTRAFAFLPTADVIFSPPIDRVIWPAAGMLMIVVGLVLLIACANLASFLLARAADRRKEIAVRLALGATRRTLVGQLLTETVLLSALGGIAGVGLAVLSLNALVSADIPLPVPMPITLDLSLDATVLTFSVLVSIGAGILFGLAPALQSTNPDLAPTLRDETAGGGRAKGTALRNLLVVGQVSLAVVLLVGAGLFLRSLDASRDVDPGFGDAPTGILQVVASPDRYSQEEARVYFEALEERIVQIPGVQIVGHTSNLLLNPVITRSVLVEVDGIDPPPGTNGHVIDGSAIDDDYLATVGIELVAGRGFDASDVVDGEPVALVNEEFVRRFFPQGDAVGRTVRINDAETQIVGVTRDTKVRQLGEAQQPYVFLSQRQNFNQFVTILARTSGDADALLLEMFAAARALDPEILVFDSKTMERHLEVMFVLRELGALVVAGFAILALSLASIGLYGVVSYAVSRRTREVGIRLSLGAGTSSVVWMLTSGGMKLVGSGLLVGLVVAAALSQLLSRLLYGVPALDPLTFVGVPVVLGIVALAASWLPARRVTRISPVGALRVE